MSYENRKRMYDQLVREGRENEIDEFLKKEFGEVIPAPVPEKTPKNAKVKVKVPKSKDKVKVKDKKKMRLW